jgi:glycosyltransferase involved in cell wall biosynthesis
MIPTYNCASYLRETLRSVLAQDLGPETMQIEVVDDHSTKDDPEAVVAELGQGRVSFFRQPVNAGHVRNFNTCLQRSRGQLVHLLHGDDQVRSGFYQKIGRAFADHPEIGAAFCRYMAMDEDGHWQHIVRLEQRQSGILPGWLERIATGQRLQTPAMVVRRDVYERLGGYDRRIRYYGEDWEMWVRIAAEYPVWYEVEPLALYRVHSNSLSGRSLRTGENAQDLRQVIEIIGAYLPPDRAAELTRTANRENAFACLRRARRLLGGHHLRPALAQLLEAPRFSRAPHVLAWTAAVFGLWCGRSLSLAFPRDRTVAGQLSR